MTGIETDKLIGQTFVKHERTTNKDGNEALVFYNEKGEGFMFSHCQDCCESVSIDDINGDLDDLLNSIILKSEKKSNSNESDCGSETWTFYKFATRKGYVTVKWYGESNGYYSEEVDLYYFKRFKL
jgi:hypothetical protein